MLLILNLNARRLRAKVCTLHDQLLSVHHDDVYRFEASTAASSTRPTVFPQDILTAISVLLERVRSALQERVLAIQAITCVIDYDCLPTADVHRDQQQTLRTLNPARTLVEQLCLPVSEPSGFQDHFFTTHDEDGCEVTTTVSAGTLVRSVLIGRLVDMDAVETAHTSRSQSATATTEARETTHASIKEQPGRVSAWMVARFGFCSSCIVTTGVMTCMASLLSFCPDADDVGIGVDRSDELLVPVTKSIKHPRYQVLPNILAELDSDDNSLAHRPYVVRAAFADAGHARNIVRDVYTKTRHAFNQLVQAVCPGGSVGLDSKLFTIYRPMGDASEGSFQRFENGTRVAEFGDLRANARCLVEGQALAIRHAYATIKALDGKAADATAYHGAAGCMEFAPFDSTNLPSRWCTWGSTAGDACISSVYALVMGRPMLVGKADVEAAHHKDDDLHLYVSRATLGAVYLASYLLYRRDATTTAAPLGFTAYTRQHACETSVFVCGGVLSKSDPDATPRPTHRRQSLWTARPAWQDELSVPCAPRRSQDHQLAVNQRERSSSQSTYAASRTRSSTTSSLHSTASSETSDGEQSASGNVTPKPHIASATMHSHELVTLAEPDHDFWLFYGAMLEEYDRLAR